MATHKHFLQDRAALLLVSVNTFTLFLSIIIVLLNLNANRGDSYTVTYRPSLGIDSFKTGTVRGILQFILFSVLVYGMSLFMAYRSHTIKRELSLVILSLTLVLIIFSTFVSYSLLLTR